MPKTEASSYVLLALSEAQTYIRRNCYYYIPINQRATLFAAPVCINNCFGAVVKQPETHENSRERWLWFVNQVNAPQPVRSASREDETNKISTQHLSFGKPGLNRFSGRRHYHMVQPCNIYDAHTSPECAAGCKICAAS